MMTKDGRPTNNCFSACDCSTSNPVQGFCLFDGVSRIRVRVRPPKRHAGFCAELGNSPEIDGSLTIPADMLSMSSTVTPIKDFVIEGDETVIWTLIGDGLSYTVGADTDAEMIILDLVDFVFKDGFEETNP
jgi:hypothetical protein